MSSPSESRPESSDAAVLRRLIADVLSVPPESVHPDADLVYELGAESIDFLDLLFSLDPLVGSRVLPEHWAAWVEERLPDARAGRGITPRVLEEFVIFYRAFAIPERPAGGVQ